ncbi:MAG: hypothetical protein M1812_001119 [Candelaria pacifica]|nr:MAG: hypothetical protein M1812_001119 [Candelaria pacifica]
MGINETRWAEKYAQPRINAYRSIEVPETPGDYISLLERYLQLIPYLPLSPSRTTISHPDLHLDNIFVDVTRRKMSIIDWQSASVSEPFLQHNIPRMLIPVGPRSSSKDSKNAPKDPNIVEDRRAAIDLLSHYQNLSKLKNKPRWAAINTPYRSLLTNPVSLICGARSLGGDRSLYPLGPCPIQFTRLELEWHDTELGNVEGISGVLHAPNDNDSIPLGGIVPRGHYERAKDINARIFKMFVDMAENPSEKAIFSQVWPYQD